MPKPQKVNHNVSLCAAIVLLLLLVVPNSTRIYALDEGEGGSPSEVQDLRYGVVLYHFYQQSYFEALTESLVGEEKADMPFHGDGAKLLSGGMSLSYGMAKKAETIFTDLLNDLDKVSEKNRAWFYLGKLNYLRDDKAATKDAFSQIDESTLEPQLKEEFIYIQASFLLNDNRVAEADAKILQLPKDSPWLAYYYFNRGAAQTVSGNWEVGVQSFQAMENLPLINSEGLILKDRARIASGFAYLGAKSYDKAIDSFIKVRLESPLSDKAMLGYGWAAAQLNDFDKALSPWQALSKKSVLKPSVQESLLAIPYIYEQIDAPVSALNEYLKATEVFERELSTIDQAIALFTNAPMSDIITDDNSLGSDWISGEDYLPLNKQAPYLAHLIAQDHFQGAIADRNDLLRMANFLNQSAQRFDALQGVLTLQNNNWRKNLGGALRQDYRERYDAMLEKQKSLQEQLALAEEEGDGRRLVSPEDELLWIRTQLAAKRIELLENAEIEIDVSEERDSLRFYQGLLTWSASENYSINKWEFTKQLIEIDELVKEAQDKLLRVEALSIDRYEKAFSNRMNEMELRINARSGSVNQALEQSEKQIRALAIDELVKQRERLSYYLGRAKLAVARLYDAGSAEAENE